MNEIAQIKQFAHGYVMYDEGLLAVRQAERWQICYVRLFTEIIVDLKRCVASR